MGCSSLARVVVLAALLLTTHADKLQHSGVELRLGNLGNVGAENTGTEARSCFMEGLAVLSTVVFMACGKVLWTHASADRNVPKRFRAHNVALFNAMVATRIHATPEREAEVQSVLQSVGDERDRHFAVAKRLATIAYLFVVSGVGLAWVVAEFVRLGPDTLGMCDLTIIPLDSIFTTIVLWVVGWVVLVPNPIVHFRGEYFVHKFDKEAEDEQAA